MLTVGLDDLNFKDVANKIRVITEIAKREKPLRDMSPEQYRANIAKHIRNAQNEDLADRMTILFGGFVFLQYSPELLEWVIRVLMGG